MKFNPKLSKPIVPGPLSDIAEGEEAAKKFREERAEGGANALLSGASMGLFDNAAAWLESLESGDMTLSC